jgi:hypothetical protein
MDNLQKAAAQSGGTLIYANLPTREQFGAMLSRFYPGCGTPIHVIGTNGGTMPCGGMLHWFGKTEMQLCGACADRGNKC